MRIRFITLHVLLPIAIGGMIYTCGRRPSLLMFSWYQDLGMSAMVFSLRQETATLLSLAPNWVVFSLPNGLWVYSVTAFMAGVWLKAPASLLRSVWLSAGLALGIGTEICQAARLIPGTFDLTDLLLCLMASVAAFIVASISFARRIGRRNEADESTSKA